MKQSTKILTKVAMLAVFATTVLAAGHANAQKLKQNNIHYLTDTTVDFNGLISQFKGKVIYVDIWATWCHPCRAELVKLHDIKAFSDFALKNNIVILYICCDRNAKSWKGFIGQNQLTGYHTFDYDKLNKDMHARFAYAQTGKIHLKKGFYIPRHILIDKTGAIADSLAGSQGDKAVYARLNKLLNN